MQACTHRACTVSSQALQAAGALIKKAQTHYSFPVSQSLTGSLSTRRVQTPDDRVAESVPSSSGAPAAGSRPTTASEPGQGPNMLAPHSSAFHYTQPPGFAGAWLLQCLYSVLQHAPG